MFRKVPLLWALLPLMSLTTLSMPALAGPYNPLETFAPLTLPQPVNRYRSASGAPGPDYWQNHADYEIHAQLDTANKQLSATEIITYTNRSPDTLTSLWIQLDQNVYRRDARSVAANPEPRKEFTDGFILDEVAIELEGRMRRADYLVSDTRMQIRLPEALKLQVHYSS